MGDIWNTILEVAIGVLSVATFLAFIRAIRGPRFTDRIVAINMIGTMVTAIICLLSAYLQETYLVDVALVYTLLSFLAVVIICHVVTLHHRGREMHLNGKDEEAEEK